MITGSCCVAAVVHAVSDNSAVVLVVWRPLYTQSVITGSCCVSAVVHAVSDNWFLLCAAVVHAVSDNWFLLCGGRCTRSQ